MGCQGDHTVLQQLRQAIKAIRSNHGARPATHHALRALDHDPGRSFQVKHARLRRCDQLTQAVSEYVVGRNTEFHQRLCQREFNRKQQRLRNECRCNIGFLVLIPQVSR